MFAACLLALALQDVPPASPGSSLPSAQGQAAAEVLREFLTDIRIQGNVATPDDEVRRLAGVEIGMAIGPTTVDDVAARLRASKKFEQVEVRKRFASIADPSRIVLVIIVDEGPVKIEMTGDPNNPTRVVRARRLNLMVLPVISAEDGYGLTYGARLAVPNVGRTGSRLSFPLTWGGDKRLGAEIDKAFGSLRGTRLLGGAALTRREHPLFEQDDDRRRVWARAEHDLVSSVRVGTTARWEHVEFLDADESFSQIGADVVLDTRPDPVLPRNAVYARAAWDRIALPAQPVGRTELEARAYLGLFGQPVLMVRAIRSDASDQLPLYLRPILGGMANLRGFPAGTDIGDTLVAGSAELFLPFTSPLSVGKAGVSLFTDVGTVYDQGERFSDQELRQGYGASLWFAAAFFRINLAVAHGIDASTRVHFGANVTF